MLSYFAQIPDGQRRRLTTIETPSQSVRSLIQAEQGTHPGVRGLAPKHVGRKDIRRPSRQLITTSQSPHEFEDKKTEKALLSTFFSGLLGNSRRTSSVSTECPNPVNAGIVPSDR
jgi:hypothetical protein